MQSTDTPASFPLPFANAAGGSYIRSIPTASQIGVSDGAASLTDGFPPLTFTPIAGGGIPPDGRDVNGVLFRVTGWARWQAAGGPVIYNGAFSAAIGGYPAGAFLQSAVTPGLFFVSTAENNATDPDAGGAGWTAVIPTKASDADVTTGTNDAKFITPLKLANLRANAADILAGLSVSKYITPAALLGASDVNAAIPGYIVLAGGLKICWGRYRSTVGESTVLIGLPITFNGPPFVALGNAFNPGQSNEMDFYVQSVTGLFTTTRVAFYLNSSDGGTCPGFDWIAIGV